MPTSILVFKTNINTLEQLKKIDCVLSHRAEVEKWTIDLDDCDKVLRIETKVLETESVMSILKPHQIYCEELL